MAKEYIPKVGDQVFLEGHSFVRYVIATIETAKKTASVKNIAGSPIVLTQNVPWSKLLPLDESQVAARIVREATENK